MVDLRGFRLRAAVCRGPGSYSAGWALEEPRVDARVVIRGDADQQISQGQVLDHHGDALTRLPDLGRDGHALALGPPHDVNHVPHGLPLPRREGQEHRGGAAAALLALMARRPLRGHSALPWLQHAPLVNSTEELLTGRKGRRITPGRSKRPR